MSPGRGGPSVGSDSGLVVTCLGVELLEPSAIVGQWFQPDLAAPLVDSVGVGQRAWLPGTADQPELGAVLLLLLALGQQDPVGQVRVVAGVGLAGLDRLAQQL